MAHSLSNATESTPAYLTGAQANVLALRTFIARVASEDAANEGIDEGIDNARSIVQAHTGPVEWVQEFGCTCRRCAGGWLSPRMRARLLDITQSKREAMDRTLEFGSFTRGRPLSGYELSDMTRYLPGALAGSMYKSVFTSWAEMFTTIHEILAMAGELPTAANVAACSALVSMKFLERGGRAEYVLDEIINTAQEDLMEEDDLDSDDEEEEEEYDERNVNPWARCANDNAFALVRQQVGLDPTLTWGPYDRNISPRQHRDGNGTTLSMQLQADIWSQYGHLLGAQGDR